MRRLLAFVLSLFGLGGCGGLTQTGGVVNLYQVDANVYRSAQPTTPEQWQYLYSLGIRDVVKLNFDSEGSDDGARALGMTVHELGIEPDENLFHTIEAPDAALLAEAERVLAAATPERKVLAHCTHGQDRTGLSIGIFRVISDGWTKDAAYAEMKDRGFHPELLGLYDFWNDFNPATFPR